MPEKRYIGDTLRLTGNLVRRYIEQSDRRTRTENITGHNNRILVYLAERELRGETVLQKHFEAHFDIRRSTATRVLQSMEKKGLVLRRPSPADARQREILLTPMARDIYAEISQDIVALESAILAGFTPQETDMLFSLLNRIQRNVRTE